MIRLTRTQIEALEERYEGITDWITRFEKEVVYACPKCGSTDTALVQVGVVGRLLAIAAATSKVAIVLNGPKPGKYKCHVCRTYYNHPASWSTGH